MGSAFGKEIRRSITHSWGRFIAIFAIVALGVGFYAGLRMTAPDMYLAADKFYDDTHLMDIRVASTLGLTQEDLDDLGKVEGVDAVMGAYEVDAVGTFEGEAATFRVHSLSPEAAESELQDDGSVTAPTDGYLNRLILQEGRWPESADECVVLGDVIMNAPVELGQVIGLTEGAVELDSALSSQNFTIVGKVRSSYYTGSAILGSTSVGSGFLDQAIYVPEGAFAPDYPFTEAFIAVAGAAGLESGSDGYNQRVDEVQQAIEAVAAGCEERRYEELRREAQQPLDDARHDYETERADAEAQLADAKAQLDSAAEELAARERQLQQGAADLAAAQERYRTEEAQARTQLASASQQLEEQAWTLTAQREEAERQRSTLQGQEAQLAPRETAVAQALAAARQQGDSQAVAALTAQQEVLNQQRSQLEAGKKSLEAAFAALESGEGQLAAARSALQAESDRASRELAAAQERMDTAEGELAAGRTALDQGRSSLQTAQADYDVSAADAAQRFADAEAQLADAQDAIDQLERPQWLVMDRTKNPGAESFRQDAARVDSIAAVFPFIFFLVAALVALTTMTRMVDEERTLIGTYKALGLGRGRIMAKYLIYAGAASISGAVAGIAALAFTLPAIIMSAYGIIYVVPIAGLALNWPIAGLSAGLGIGITLIATLAAVGASLRETPAALILPPAPKAGKRILLERIGPLWRRLSFLWKVTMRNIFRYKKRFLMTVIGIAGCTALLLTGFGLNDSINDIIDRQYGPIVDHTVAVTLEDGAEDGQKAALEELLANAAAGEGGDAGEGAWVMRDSLLVVGGRSGQDPATSPASEGDGGAADGASQGTDLTVNLIVPENTADFQELWHLRDRQSGDAIILEEGAGAVVTEKLAAKLALGPGDALLVSERDLMGNRTGDARAIPVAAVAENYVDNYVFLTPGLYEQTFGEAPAFATLFGRIPDDAAARKDFTEAASGLEAVGTIEFNDETIESYRTALRSVSLIVVVLIVAAAALAFIVLYNLTNINISERVREIATLKVLGFTRREVRHYIFRETIMLTVLGALLGLGLGVFLENFVVVTAEVDAVMFGRVIHGTSFLLAFCLTLLFGALVMAAMGPKLRAVSMVESLKSVE